MPLPVVYPAVAVRVKDKLKIEDDGAFYLGSIAPDADRAPAYCNDTDLADLALYRTEPWVPEVYAALESARGEAADDMLTAEEVEKRRLRQLHRFEQDFSHLKPAEYITREETDRCIGFAAEKCLEYFGVK